MTHQPHDWTGDRGDSWREHLDALEGTLAPVNGPLVSAARLESGHAVAEIGCGGGGATGSLFEAVSGGIVHAYDISPSLVEVSKKRFPSRAHAFRIADASSVVPGVSYDRLVSRFGVMFFDEPTVAFTNVARWMKPGGRVTFAVWGLPADNPWVGVPKRALAEVTEVPAGDPDGPGPFRYKDPSVLVGLLQQAGLRDLEVETWSGLLPLGGGLAARPAAKFALSAFGVCQRALKGASDVTWQAAEEAVTGALEDYEEDGVVRLAGAVHLVTGRSAR